MRTPATGSLRDSCCMGACASLSLCGIEQGIILCGLCISFQSFIGFCDFFRSVSAELYVITDVGQQVRRFPIGFLKFTIQCKLTVLYLLQAIQNG